MIMFCYKLSLFHDVLPAGRLVNYKNTLCTKMATALLQNTYCFSSNCAYFSHISDDGKIKIWDTSTGLLKQEFIKNFHLSTPVTTILWLQLDKSPRKKKKLHTTNHVSNNLLEILALGTSNGNILLFDVVTNQVTVQLEEHSNKINYLSCSKSNDLFSCSDDRTVLQWDISSNKVKNKLKDKKDKIKCVIPMSDDVHLLTAGYVIKLWNLENKEIIKTFSGHATEITTLIEVPGLSTYFFSASAGDRIISAWSLLSKTEHAVSSFLLDDNSAAVHVSVNQSKSTTISATTSSGTLHFFKHQLNGVTAKPLKPKRSVSIVSQADGNVTPIPVVAHQELQDGRVLVVYGTSAFYSFETIVLEDKQDKELVLVRELKKKVKISEFNNKSKTPDINDEVEYKTSVSVTPRKRTNKNNVDVALEERLENLAIAQPQTSSTNVTVDNMSQLLIQGLQSKDKRILHQVLMRQDEDVINTTIKYLPVNAVVPLIKELIILMQGRTYTRRISLKWLKVLLKIHAGYLIANPQIADVLQPLLSTVESRLTLFAPLLRLSGRLSLVTEQIDNNIHQDETKLIEPLLTYQVHDSTESSSDDEYENSEVDDDETGNEWSESSDNEEMDTDEPGDT